MLLPEWHIPANISIKLIIEYGAFVEMDKLQKEVFGKLHLLLVFMNLEIWLSLLMSIDLDNLKLPC